MSDSVILGALESLHGHPVPQADPSNRRESPRYETGKQVTLIPVLPDGTLNWAARQVGSSVNVSEGGIGIQLQQVSGELPSSLLIGVEGDDGQTRFTGVQVRYTKPSSSNGVYLGAAFGGSGHELLGDGTLAPRFNPVTFSFEHSVAQELLEHWVRAGVLTARVSDQVQVCPQCRSLPTFRDGCRKCGSARAREEELVHHFACAHVGPSSDFQTEKGLVCPKCRTDRLVVGADFEYLRGEYCCTDCNWRDSSLESIGHCLRCNHRFAASAAEVQNVVVYSANRLNWQQIIDTETSGNLKTITDQ